MISIKRKGMTLKLFEEDMPNPRNKFMDEDEYLGKMICFHSRYRLGDDHDFSAPVLFEQYLENNQNDIYCVLPLYLLDHSGLAMSTYSFHDDWDSGQVGYIYCTKEAAKRMGFDLENDYEAVEEELREEVKEYDNWLQGNPPYYSYIITDEDDRVVENRGVFACEDFSKMIKEMKEDTDEKYGFLFNSLLKQEIAEM